MSDFLYILKGMKELNTSDGTAFTVNIYRGKKKIGTLENAGRGGADMVWIDPAEQAAWSAWSKSLEPFRSAPTTSFPEGLVLNHPEESAVAYLMQVFEDAEEASWLDRQSKTKIVAVANAAPERQYTLVHCRKGEGPAGTQALLPQLFSDSPKIQKVWIVGEGWVTRAWSAPTALNTGTPMVNDMQTQALRRIDAYYTQLHRLGLHMDTPIRVLGVLTSGLPGEVLELSLLDETGHLTTHRARPINSIPAAATAIHGLTDDALCQAWPLARRHAALLTRLRSPDTQGQAVKVIAWAGGFVTQALETSLGKPLGLPILSIQDAIAAGDQVLTPGYPYRPSLAAMNWTVPLDAPDKASSASIAVSTAQLLKLIFARQAIHHPPRRN